MSKKMIISLLALAIITFLIIAANTTTPSFTPTSGKENPLIILTSEKWVTLDPAIASDAASAKIINNVFEGLVRYKPNSVVVEPALATSWQIREDGKVWLFTLRQGVTFHDQTPFNAQAVKFSVERVLAGQGTMPYAEMTFGMVDKVTVLSDYAVKFTLKYPFAPFLQNLAQPWAAPIVSPASVPHYNNNNFACNPVGTGAYRLAPQQPNQGLLLVANKNHWRGAPLTPKVLFKTEPNYQKRLALLASGEADIADHISPQQVSLARQKGLVVVQQPAISINYLGFYTNKAPFTSSRLRRALVMAIDREKLIQELYAGMLMPAASHLPPKMLGHSPDLKQYPHNIKAAQELLKNNGYPDGMDLTLITYQGCRPYNPAGGEKLAEAIKDQLALVAIRVTIRAYPWEEYKKALYRQEGHFFLYGWVGDNGDPDNFLYTVLTTPQIERGLNPARYANPQVDRLLFSARQIMDNELRQRLYYHAQQIILQDAPWVLFNHGYHFAAIRPDIKNFNLQPIGGYYLYPVHKFEVRVRKEAREIQEVQGGLEMVGCSV